MCNRGFFTKQIKDNYNQNQLRKIIMNSKLEKILMQEASNTNRIYLHYSPQHGHWVAYEQSALNLLSLAPLLLPR